MVPSLTSPRPRERWAASSRLESTHDVARRKESNVSKDYQCASGPHRRLFENDGMGITGYTQCACCMAAFRLRMAREEAAKIPSLEKKLEEAQAICQGR